MNSPIVSIVVLTYFHEKYIRQALDSIFSQKTKYSYEVVVADDCSTDNTRSIVAEYKEKYSNIIVESYNAENTGIPINLYNGLLKCKGKYITLLSGDDYWLGEDSLDRKIDFLENNEKYFALCTQIETRRDNDGALLSISPKKRYLNKDLTLKMYMKGVPFHTHGFVMRNIMITDEGKEYFSHLYKCSKYIDDSTMCLLVLMKGSVYLMGETAYCYRYQDVAFGGKNFNSSNTLLMKAKKEIDLYNSFNKYFPDLDLIKLYERCLARAFAGFIVSKDRKGYKEIYKSIPANYRKRGLKIRTLPIIIKKSLIKIVKKLKAK